MMKKILSVFVVIVLALLLASPVIPDMYCNGADGDGSAVVFTASDFQSADYMRNLDNMLAQAKNDTPDKIPAGFLFGGDYYSNDSADTDATLHVNYLKELVNRHYPYYDTDKISFIQGNHDLPNELFKSTGLHEAEEYSVIALNEADLTSNNMNSAKNAAEILRECFNRLLVKGSCKPVFVMSHVPIHHNPRTSYMQSHAMKHVFDVVNEYAGYMDVIFLFGHNHSSTYDDYIGGSVNFIPKGDIMYVSRLDSYGADQYTAEKINFTYMNYGYAGYSGNTAGEVNDPYTGNTVISTNEITLGKIEILPDVIRFSRYNESGMYGEIKTVKRTAHSVKDEPYAVISAPSELYEGDTVTFIANTFGVESAEYYWESSDSSVVEIKAVSDSNVRVYCAAAGNAEIRLTAKNDKKSVTAGYIVQIKPAAADKKSAQITFGLMSVDGTQLDFYGTPYSENIPFGISLCGIRDEYSLEWHSSDESVLSVKDGTVTVNGGGTAQLSCTVKLANEEYSSSVLISTGNGQRLQYTDKVIGYSDIFRPAEALTPGRHYVIFVEDSADSPSEKANVLLTGEKSEDTLKAMPVTPQTDHKGELITTDNQLAVWECSETDKSGYYYLRNAASGEYLVISFFRNGSSERDAVITTAPLENGQFDAAAYKMLYVENSSSKTTLRSLEQRKDTNGIKSEYLTYSGGSFVAADTYNETFLYEAESLYAPQPASVHIEMNGVNIEGSEKQFYSVASPVNIPVYARYQGFANDVSIEFSSDNQRVAAVDKSGLVILTGKEGRAVITLTVCDSAGSLQTASFTVAVSENDSPKRIFRQTDKLSPDRKYIIAGINDVLSSRAFVLSDRPLNDIRSLPVVLEFSCSENSEYLYIEADSRSLDGLVWVSAACENDGSYKDSASVFNFYTEASVVSTEEGFEITDASLMLSCKITGFGDNDVVGRVGTVTASQADSSTQFIYEAGRLLSHSFAEVSAASVTYKDFSFVSYYYNCYFAASSRKQSDIYFFEELEEIVDEPEEASSPLLSVFEFFSLLVRKIFTALKNMFI